MLDRRFDVNSIIITFKILDKKLYNIMSTWQTSKYVANAANILPTTSVCIPLYTKKIIWCLFLRESVSFIWTLHIFIRFGVTY